MVPWQVEALAGIRALQIACGVYHTLVTTERGIFMWGTETAGRAPQATDLLPALVPGSDSWDVAHIASGGFHVAALVRASQPSGQHHKKGRGQEDELSLSHSTAISKMLKTVTSAETRRKLRDALARHGSSASPSLSRSTTSTQGPLSESSGSVVGDAVNIHELGSSKESNALHDALEIARTSYHKRTDRAQRSTSSSSATSPESYNRKTSSAQPGNVSGDAVEKVIQRARRAGQHMPGSAAGSPDSAGSGATLNQLKQANMSLRSELQDVWDSPMGGDRTAQHREARMHERGYARAQSSSGTMDKNNSSSMSHMKEIQELEHVVAGLERGVQEQHLNLNAEVRPDTQLE